MLKIKFYLSGSLALGALMGGCTLPGTQPKPPVVVVPSPVASPPVLVTPVPQIVANPGLIQPTNPNERLKQIKVANKDPFAANQPTALIITTAPTKESGAGSKSSGKSGDSSEGSSDISDFLGESEGDKTTGKSQKQVVRANSGSKASPNQAGGKDSKDKAAKTKGAKNNSNTKKTNSETKNALGRPGKINSGTKKGGSGNTGKNNNNKTPSPNSEVRPSVPVITDNPVAVNSPNLPGGNPGTDVPPIGNPGTNIGEIPDTPSQPQLASQVEIRGVVQLDNGYSYAIVKGPNEKSSTNLTQGDTVPNTSILVKRIEVGQAEGRMSGMVVLEENGIEVTRPVGEKVASAGGETDQGGANNFSNPNTEGLPPDHGGGNPGNQQFGSPSAQPPSNPPTTVPPGVQPTVNPPSTVPPGVQPTVNPSETASPTAQPTLNPPGTIVPTPIPSPQLSPSSPNPLEDR